MGFDVRPQGAEAFGNFFKSQETSPTLVLSHARIGDDSAREVAHFLAPNTHLVRLDLSGNDITPAGALQLAGALKQNKTLESLVLKHNYLGDTDSAGFDKFCRAVGGHQSLRHLDLRHNSLTGAPAATCLGEMLHTNTVLTHLELSWNPLGPAGGDILLQCLRRNTSIFDCQLSGCEVPQETLVGIAELLHRNRRANGADLSAGPYQASVNLAAGSTGARSMARALGEEHSTPEPLELAAAERSATTNSIVSRGRTDDLMAKLLRRVASGHNRDRKATLRAQEMYELLDRSQKSIAEESDMVGGIRERVELLSQGFQAREARYRSNLATGRDALLEFAEEQTELKAILARFRETLALHRESADEARREARLCEQRSEAEEARAMNVIATNMAERRELSKRVATLEEACAQQVAENAKLRARLEKVRHGVVLSGAVSTHCTGA